MEIYRVKDTPTYCITTLSFHVNLLFTVYSKPKNNSLKILSAKEKLIFS
jgi:hypothetical protein